MTCKKKQHFWCIKSKNFGATKNWCKKAKNLMEGEILDKNRNFLYPNRKSKYLVENLFLLKITGIFNLRIYLARNRILNIYQRYWLYCKPPPWYTYRTKRRLYLSIF